MTDRHCNRVRVFTPLFIALPILSFGSPARPEFERVLPLDPGEGIFAYARVSPDGRHLAFASERGKNRTVTLVDLTTKKKLFTEPGLDAYFSTEGDRVIYISSVGRADVAIYHLRTGAIARQVAPAALGDYLSWGVRNGRDLILTIRSKFYYLNGAKAVLPAGSVMACEGIGVGERPLLSRDGKRITTFVRGTVVVRNLTDCAYIFDTGLQGAKADFSWDGRYIAFHAPKSRGDGYDIQVVDLENRTVRTVTRMPGSSYFPSWTKDGRLNFRYDGPEYRGFLMATNVLSAPPRPLPTTPERMPKSRSWSDVFPETPRPNSKLSLVLLWSTWSATAPTRSAIFRRRGNTFGAMTLTLLYSRPRSRAASNRISRDCFDATRSDFLAFSFRRSG